MKNITILILSLFPLFAFAEEESPAVKAEAPKAAPKSYYGKIGQRLAKMLPRYHVLQQPLDDQISQRAWTNLVTYYDYDHSVFLKSDLEKLANHEFTIDDELGAGDVSFGYEVYELYRERLNERIDFATNLLAAANWDFTSNETYRIKRKDAPWPETKEEAEEYWVRRLKNEVLAQTLARVLDEEEKAAKGNVTKDESISGEILKGEIAAVNGSQTQEGEDEYGDDPKLTPEENLIKKYRQYYHVLCEPDEEAILQNYLSSVTRAYDPHSDYMSPASKEDFDMDMNLSLCGVGAVLGMDDGALKIAEIMPGGPMDKDGRIQEGDKIIGVKQENGELEDIMWQPTKKSIRKIRGPKGTRVTLQIIPRSDPSGATVKMIELVRDEIKLEDQAATGRVERVTIGDTERKLGYVYLPSFYGSMDKNPGEEGYRSCADDVAKLVAQFNAQDVEGLVLDLRSDGGGSLREAVMLSALFVPNGPVVQIRDTRSVSPLSIPRGNPVAFKKPMVVLIDRASASASEIVAGHLRDTGRAIVLGDTQSHGKGTVQTVLGMGPEKYGSVKITTARFYRIDGRSTQVKGVASDIRLPSLLDSLGLGEDKLTYALPFTKIRKADFVKCWNLDSFIPELQERSAKRLAENERYQKHISHVDGMKAVGEREFVPLEREARLEMMRQDRELAESDSDSENSNSSDEKKSRRRRNQLKSDDIVLDEAFDILSDLVELNGGNTLQIPQIQWYNAILGL